MDWLLKQSLQFGDATDGSKMIRWADLYASTTSGAHAKLNSVHSYGGEPGVTCSPSLTGPTCPVSSLRLRVGPLSKHHKNSAWTRTERQHRRQGFVVNIQEVE